MSKLCEFLNLSVCFFSRKQILHQQQMDRLVDIIMDGFVDIVKKISRFDRILWGADPTGKMKWDFLCIANIV